MEKRDLRAHEKISGEIRLIMSYEYIKVRGRGEREGEGEERKRWEERRKNETCGSRFCPRGLTKN